MNTPEPCCSCENLYVNCLYKDCEWYDAECKLDLSMGNKDCPKYEKDKSIIEYENMLKRVRQKSND